MKTNLALLVEIGAEILDENKAGWRSEVDPESLDMGSRDNDLLTQIFGDYDHGLRVLKVPTEDAYLWGFCVDERQRLFGPIKKYTDDLTDAWLQAVSHN